MVDWSAASSPKTGQDSIWIGELTADTGRTRYSNPPTRHQAYNILVSTLRKARAQDKRVLVGFDFSLGYPRGTAAALHLTSPSWSDMHDYLTDAIEDAPDNTNNRFQIAAKMNARMSDGLMPFWGVTSSSHAGPNLGARKPNFADCTLAEYRIAERFIRDAGRAQPKSCWQLAYIGSVGSQSLTGIPYVTKLRRRFQEAKIWPFETGFRTPLLGTKIVIAEIYPSLVTCRPRGDEPHDKAQIRAITRHYWEMDKLGVLEASFAPPNDINAENLSIINAEEGWILGITPINIGNLAS